MALRAGPPELTGADVETRLALGPALARPLADGVDETERLLSIAEHIVRVEPLPANVYDPLYLAVLRARLDDVRAGGTGPAHERRREVERRAIRLAHDAIRPAVVLALALDSLDPPMDLVEASLVMPPPSSIGSMAPLWPRLSATGRARVEIHEGVPSGLEAPPLDALVGLGTDGHPAIERRLADAHARADLDGIVRVARAMVEVDPYSITSRAILIAERELAAGVLTDRTILLDIASRSARPDAWPVARLLAAHEASPASESVVLALAFALLEVEASPDAIVLAGELAAAREASAEGRLLAQLVVAVAHFDLADPEVWNELVMAHPDIGRSPSATAVPCNRVGSGAVAAAIDGAVRACRRGRVAAGSLHGDYLVAVAADPDAEASLRRTAIEREALIWPEIARALTGCLVDDLDRDECDDRLGALRVASEAETEPGAIDGALLSHLPPELDANMAAVIARVPSTMLGEATRFLDRLAPTAIGLTARWVQARGAVAARAGDRATLERLVSERGALLGTGARALFRAAIHDLTAGRAVDTFSTSPSFAPPTLVERTAEEPPSGPIPTGATAALHCAAEWWLHSSEDVRRCLTVAETAVGSTEPALFAALRARFDDVTVDVPALTAAAGDDDPDGVGQAFLRALAADRTGDSTAAAAYADVLAFHFETYDTLRRTILRSGAAGTDIRRIAAMLHAVDPTSGRAIEGLVVRGEVTDADTVLALEDRDARAIRANLEVLAGEPSFADVVDRQLDDALEREILAATPADALALARALLPAARRREAEGPLGRGVAAYFAVLARDTTAFTEIADRARTSSHDTPPLVFHHTLREIARVSDHLSDEVLHTIVVAALAGEYERGVPLLVAANDPALATLLCAYLVNTTQYAEAAAICVPAYLATPGPLLATQISILAVDAPESCAAMGFDVDAFFDDAVPRFDEGAHGLLAWNVALALADRDRDRSAALARTAELHGRSPGHIADWEAPQADLRGVELRYRYEESDGHPRDLERAFLALAEGRPAIASQYLDVLFYYRSPDALATLSRAYLARDLVHWASSDLEGGRLDVAGLVEEERFRTDDLGNDGLVALADRYPSSVLLAIDMAVHHVMAGDTRAAAEAAIRVLERDPRPTAAVALRTQLAGYEGREAATARIEALRREFPDDPRLAAAVEEPLPPQLETAEALAVLLAAPTEADLARLEPAFRISEGTGGGAALPARAPAHPESLGILIPGGALVVQVEPRPSECAPEQCLDVLVPALERSGLSLVWRAPATIPMGAGGRFLMRTGDRLALFTIVPRGSRLYVLGIFGPSASVAGRLAAYALLERTFVPLDVVAPASWSARIVGTPAAPWTAYHQAVATLASASPTATTCPIRRELDAVTDAAQRAEVLRVLYLGEGEPGRRRALFACTDARTSPDGLLGLASAVDPDPGARRLGLPHLRAMPAPAVTLLTDILGEAEVARPLAGVPHRESDLPVFGLVEALLALPETERRALTRTMWERNEPRLRVLVGMADEVLPGSVDHEIVREALRTGTVADALAMTGALYQSEDDADFDAARARLGALVAPFDEPSRQLALTLSWLLARHLATADEPPLRALATRMSDAASSFPEDSEDRLRLSWTAEQVTHEADVVHASLARGLPDDEELASSVEVYRGMRSLVGGRTSTAVARSLATESLARVLPGTHWSYVRVPSPSLLGATLEAMYARLESGSAADGAIARRALEWMLERSNADLLGDEGGLDMDRPIECATADRFPRAWVCAVYVEDADAVRAHLARRRIGTNSGAWMIVEAASYARSLPIAAGAIPFELDEIMRAEGPAPSSRLGAVLTRERARTEVDLDGVHVERYATFAAREGDAPSVDTEHYLFTGDRLVMFGLEETARVILAAPRPLARTLAGASAFRELTDGWSEGAVLQLVNVDYRDRMLPSPLPHDDFGLEVVATDDGLVARIRMPLAETTMTGVEELRSRLPEGAISTLAFVPDPDEVPETDPETAPEGLSWQSLVISRSERFALGWYGATSETVWDRWLVATRPTERLRTLLSGWSLLPPAGDTRSADGVVLGLTADGALIVGTTEAMVRDAMARTPSTSERAVLGSARLDGLLAASVARSLAEGIRSEDPRRESLLFLGAMMGLARDIGFSAEADAGERELVLSAHVSPNLGEPGEDRLIVDGALREARNGVTLPRAPTPAELTHPLRLVVDTTEPDVVATRAFGGSPRVRAETRPDGLLWVTIAPGTSAPVPLEAVERARLLSSPSWLRSDAESVRTLATELAPRGTTADAAARTIVRWVHDNVRYELTAAELDAPTVLERRVGDCSELARVTVALLRASGVPAEIREGFLVTGADLGAHAWVAYHDGATFREIDPTAGRADVDAGYIPSSVLTVMGLAALGELRITEVVRGD